MTLRCYPVNENEGRGKALGSLGSFTFKKYTLRLDAIYIVNNSCSLGLQKNFEMLQEKEGGESCPGRTGFGKRSTTC